MGHMAIFSIQASYTRLAGYIQSAVYALYATRYARTKSSYHPHLM